MAQREVLKPFPRNWRDLPFYLRLRIERLTFALPFCKGRAADVRPHVLAELAELKCVLHARSLLYDHVWHWNGNDWRPVYRKGERCRVYCRASKNSIGVEFEDGKRYCTSRHAVRPMQVKDVEPKQAFDAAPQRLTIFDLVDRE